MTQHKPALRPPAASTAERRAFAARKRAAVSTRAVAKCRAANTVAPDRAVTDRAVSSAANLRPARIASRDVPGDPAGARRMRGATEGHPVRYPVRNAEPPAAPRHRRRSSASTSDSTNIRPLVGEETRVNLGATRVGNLFTRLQLHLATARFLAELRADALWENACRQAALALDSLAYGMTPEALATPLHPRVPPGERVHGDGAPRTPAQTLTCALDARLGRGSGTSRISAPAAPDVRAVTARHFATAVMAPGCGAPATSDSDALTARGPVPARTASCYGTRTAGGSTSALIASPAPARIVSDSGACFISGATFNTRRATPVLAVPNANTLTTPAHPSGPSPHRAPHQPLSRHPLTRRQGTR